MPKNFKTLCHEIERRWKRSAELAKIPEEGYQPEVKIVSDPSGALHFTFGVILNSYRYQKPVNVTGNCPLCEVVEEVRETPERNLDLKSELPDYIIIPNKFPIVRGVSMAVHTGIEKNEQPMFSTSALDGLEYELEKMFTFTTAKGFQAYHNSDGLGASITRHEHWHLTNYGEVYILAGDKYGFDVLDYESSKSTKVQLMPDFPFAHLIFNQNDPERIVSFLRKIGEEIGDRYENGTVPHAICQSINGESIFIVPARNYSKRGIGSGETAGHIVVKTKEDFEKADYSFCLNILNERLFRKSEINLEKFL